MCVLISRILNSGNKFVGGRVIGDCLRVLSG